MTHHTTIGAIRITLLFVGLVLLGASSALSSAAKRVGGAWPSHARTVGFGLAALGLFLFATFPGFHGTLPSPVLLILTTAYPLIAVEQGRGMPGKVFAWSALGLLVPGCAASAILPLTWRSIQLQDTLLFVGLVAPPCAAALASPAAWAYHRLSSRTRGGHR